MNKVKYLIYSILILLLSNFAFAEVVDIQSKVDKTTITIGDRVEYEVMLNYDDGVEIEPSIIAGNLGEFEIKDYKIEEPEKLKSGKWASKATYTITTFTTGEFIIPAIEIKYKGLDGNENTVSSEEIKITVKSVERLHGEGDDIRPLKGPADIKERLNPWLIILILLIVIGLLSFFYFRRKKKIQKTADIPSIPPEETAMSELRALLDMKLIEKGMVKEYYIRLSDIMRKFIEGIFKISAMEETTWELYQEMRVKRIERRSVDKIRDFLEDCDLVKFAKYIPAQKEIEDIYKQAEEIIKLTTPSPCPTA